jgi:isopentenyl-diphosphate Delta-isomerase
MKRVTPISTRKSDHIRINLEEDVQSGLSTGLERYRFIHRALPELNLEEVDMSLDLFGRRLRAPILISSMTGGNDQAAALNRILASAAQQTGVAMGLGSQRAAIDHPELAFSFQVRREAPDVLLLANLGAVQLNYGYGIAQCQQAVEMVEADALILHFNPLQEALQIDGNTNFAGLIKKVEDICRALPVPVIAKEVGWGFSELDIHMLAQTGIAAIDVAGAGGTSWSQVEMHRATDDNQARLAASFVDWGIPTCETIRNVRQAAPGMMVFASGGLRSGVDIAKSIALGATLGGMAQPFLKAAASSLDVTIQSIEGIRREIQVCMFAAGVRDLVQLRKLQLMEIKN